jgi:hypothetical protein
MGNRRSTLILAIAVSLLVAAHCGNKPPPDGEGDPASCVDACAHLDELGCPEAEPTPEGATCVEVCRNVETSGTITLNPACVVEIDECAQVDECVEYGEAGTAGAAGAAGSSAAS